jgi:trimeric autotransporter adhesin
LHAQKDAAEKELLRVGAKLAEARSNSQSLQGQATSAALRRKKQSLRETIESSEASQQDLHEQLARLQAEIETAEKELGTKPPQTKQEILNKADEDAQRRVEDKRFAAEAGLKLKNIAAALGVTKEALQALVKQADTTMQQAHNLLHASSDDLSADAIRRLQDTDLAAIGREQVAIQQSVALTESMMGTVQAAIGDGERALRSAGNLTGNQEVQRAFTRAGEGLQALQQAKDKSTQSVQTAQGFLQKIRDAVQIAAGQRTEADALHRRLQEDMRTVLAQQAGAQGFFNDMQARLDATQSMVIVATASSQKMPTIAHAVEDAQRAIAETTSRTSSWQSQLHDVSSALTEAEQKLSLSSSQARNPEAQLADLRAIEEDLARSRSGLQKATDIGVATREAVQDAETASQGIFVAIKQVLQALRDQAMKSFRTIAGSTVQAAEYIRKWQEIVDRTVSVPPEQAELDSGDSLRRIMQTAAVLEALRDEAARLQDVFNAQGDESPTSVEGSVQVFQEQTRALATLQRLSDAATTQAAQCEREVSTASQHLQTKVDDFLRIVEVMNTRAESAVGAASTAVQEAQTQIASTQALAHAVDADMVEPTQLLANAVRALADANSSLESVRSLKAQYVTNYKAALTEARETWKHLQTAFQECETLATGATTAAKTATAAVTRAALDAMTGNLQRFQTSIQGELDGLHSAKAAAVQALQVASQAIRDVHQAVATLEEPLAGAEESSTAEGEAAAAPVGAAAADADVVDDSSESQGEEGAAVVTSEASVGKAVEAIKSSVEAVSAALETVSASVDTALDNAQQAHEAAKQSLEDALGALGKPDDNETLVSKYSATGQAVSAFEAIATTSTASITDAVQTAESTREQAQWLTELAGAVAAARSDLQAAYSERARAVTAGEALLTDNRTMENIDAALRYAKEIFAVYIEKVLSEATVTLPGPLQPIILAAKQRVEEAVAKITVTAESIVALLERWTSAEQKKDGERNAAEAAVSALANIAGGWSTAGSIANARRDVEQAVRVARDTRDGYVAASAEELTLNRTYRQTFSTIADKAEMLTGIVFKFAAALQATIELFEPSVQTEGQDESGTVPGDGAEAVSDTFREGLPGRTTIHGWQGQEEELANTIAIIGQHWSSFCPKGETYDNYERDRSATSAAVSDALSEAEASIKQAADKHRQATATLMDTTRYWEQIGVAVDALESPESVGNQLQPHFDLTMETLKRAEELQKEAKWYLHQVQTKLSNLESIVQAGNEVCGEITSAERAMTELQSLTTTRFTTAMRERQQKHAESLSKTLKAMDRSLANKVRQADQRISKLVASKTAAMQESIRELPSPADMQAPLHQALKAIQRTANAETNPADYQQAHQDMMMATNRADSVKRKLSDLVSKAQGLHNAEVQLAAYKERIESLSGAFVMVQDYKKSATALGTDPATQARLSDGERAYVAEAIASIEQDEKEAEAALRSCLQSVDKDGNVQAVTGASTKKQESTPSQRSKETVIALDALVDRVTPAGKPSAADSGVKQMGSAGASSGAAGASSEAAEASSEAAGASSAGAGASSEAAGASSAGAETSSGAAGASSAGAGPSSEAAGASSAGAGASSEAAGASSAGAEVSIPLQASGLQTELLNQRDDAVILVRALHNTADTMLAFLLRAEEAVEKATVIADDFQHLVRARVEEGVRELARKATVAYNSAKELYEKARDAVTEIEAVIATIQSDLDAHFLSIVGNFTTLPERIEDIRTIPELRTLPEIRTALAGTRAKLTLQQGRLLEVKAQAEDVKNLSIAAGRAASTTADLATSSIHRMASKAMVTTIESQNIADDAVDEGPADPEQTAIKEETEHTEQQARSTRDAFQDADFDVARRGVAAAVTAGREIAAAAQRTADYALQAAEAAVRAGAPDTVKQRAVAHHRRVLRVTTRFARPQTRSTGAGAPSGGATIVATDE